jgi:protein-L-isoaspartate(D-aspartate) O-methyltransferase
MTPVLDPRELLLRELAAEVDDRRVLEAIASVPRQLFVPEGVRRFAWLNQPLPIGERQSISQPLVVAHMCELLRLTGSERVLDVGTGSGYHAAILSRLAGHVHSIERHASLAAQAGVNLRAAGIGNVTLVVGDGTRGWAEGAPYDAINVAAASADGIPPALEDQLAAGGRLVLPVGGRDQRLVLVERLVDGSRQTTLRGVRFVPLVADRDRPPGADQIA